MAERGVLYMVWGKRHEAMLERSIASVRDHHPELPVHVERLPDDSTLLDKAAMADASPFEQTLFLDADTVVLDRLDFGFDKAERFGVALAINENPWARRYAGIDGETVEYNNGVVFFTPQARPIFDAWRDCVNEIDSRQVIGGGGKFRQMPVASQASFAVAVERSGAPPFVLPVNWNLRPNWHRSWFGPIKIWHSFNPPPEGVLAFNRNQLRPEAVIQYCAFRESKRPG